MGWGKPFSKKGWATKALQAAAPVAAAFIPGVGPLLAAGIGAGIGSLGGGGLQGAAIGGLTGGLSGIAAPAIKAGIGGLAAGGTLGSALSGAGTAAGSALSGVGSTLSSGISGLGGLFGGGTAAAGTGATVADLGTAMPWLSGTGTGVAGGATAGLAGSGTGSSLLSGLGKIAGLGGLLSAGTSLYSGQQNYESQKDARDMLLQGQEKAAGVLNPYLESGGAANKMLTDKLASGELGGDFNPGDLTNTPGYKFDLAQGEEALKRKQAASGNYFSGAALKEAQDYGTGLASKTYNDAYQQWLQGQQNKYNQLSGQAGVGANAAGSLGNIYGQMGETRAGAEIAGSNTINKTLAALLAGSGAIGQPQYDRYGNLIRA